MDPSWPLLVPKIAPHFELDADGETYYSRLTIDDFSPLVVFGSSGRGDDDDDLDDGDDDWTTASEDLSSDGPEPDAPNSQERQWGLGTYTRTENDERRNGTVKIEFWGSELQLFGDVGPAYGVFMVQVDDETPTVHSAHAMVLATGKSSLMHTLSNLTEGRHEVTITAGGTREGLVEGPGFLFDFAVARQKVGENGIVGPNAQDVTQEGLLGLVHNGTWGLVNLQDDLQPGEGGMKPAIYIERVALETTENGATLIHRFQGFAVQVFGGRNATHGAYIATLTDVASGDRVHSAVYEGGADCDERDDDEDTIDNPCAWRGSVLKFAAADLDPSIEYELSLQNVHRGDARVLELDMIRVIGTGTTNTNNVNVGSGGGGAGTGGGNGNGTSGTGNGDNTTDTSDDQTNAARMGGIDPLANLLVLMMVFVAMWRALKH